MKKFAERFEELEIWQEDRILYRDVYHLLSECRDYAFREQMRRAVLSVMNNVAEGFERRTSKDFGHFLDIAKGSGGGVRSMTYAAQNVNVLKNSDAVEVRTRYETLSKRVAAFRKSLIQK